MNSPRIDPPIQVWDGPAPGSEDWTHERQQYHSPVFDTEVVTNVVVPTITPVVPADPDGRAAIIAPGGGYHSLSIRREGFEVAGRLVGEGITCFVLEYRLVPCEEEATGRMVTGLLTGDTTVLDDMARLGPLAAADARAALTLVRSRAAEWSIDPDRVGFVGFSAGGNVGVRLAFADAGPAWNALIYASQRDVELGDLPDDAGPLFCVVAADDPLGLVGDSIDLTRRWLDAGRSAELHLYAGGGHGFGMGVQGLPSDSWCERLVDWLRQLD